MALISLTEWAKREGLESSTARKKAAKGLLKTAQKIGRNWVIDEREKNKDNRRKEMTFYKNINKGNILTEEEYKELVEREAKEYYEEYLNGINEDEEVTPFSDFLNKMYENDRDFIIVDENGNMVEEW